MNEYGMSLDFPLFFRDGKIQESSPTWVMSMISLFLNSL
jgi:hypothetical protein